MFTGIIEETGTIAGMERQPDSIRLTVRADKVLENTIIGDSIAVNVYDKQFFLCRCNA